MNERLQLNHHPKKPLMVFDGDCGFCRKWIRRWERATGERIEYLPFQDESLRESYPDLPVERCAKAVQLIGTDGVVCQGAEAVFEALARAGKWRWAARCYHGFPPFRWLTEWMYRRVARNREFFSRFA